MATNVCICEDNLTVDGAGRLCVKHDCSLVDGPSGLSLPVMQVFGYDSDSTNYNSGAEINSGGIQIGGTITATVTNPSTCRSMRVQVVEADTTLISMASNDAVNVHHRRIVNGGPLSTSLVEHHGPIADARLTGNRHEVTYFEILAPGATLTIVYNELATLTGGSGGSVMSQATVSLALWGIII